MDTETMLADARGLPMPPLRGEPLTPEVAVLLAPRAALMVIVLLSLGLWLVIWVATTFVASARL